MHSTKPSAVRNRESRKPTRAIVRFGASVCVVALALLAPVASGEPITNITIDGSFGDWASVPSYFDPDAAADGSVLHCGVPDVHDTDHSGRYDVPAAKDHVDVDLLEYKFTHDTDTLYAYFRADGVVGRTQADPPKAGRYYVIVTIDVDDDDVTGYWAHEGGYYPTSPGYDVNMELEFYNDAYNTGHYINHGAWDTPSLDQAFADQKLGVMDVLPGTYDWYTQWVWWDATDPPTAQEISDCSTYEDGPYTLPDGSMICFVQDRGPVFQGILTYASSPDGHEMEMAAPFRGFMKYKSDGVTPIIGMGSVLDISISLEASGELSGSGDWASDTADPIIGYVVGTDTVEAPAGKMYFTDNGTQKIQRANINGTNVEDVLTELSTPKGLAIDSVSERLYWTDTGTGKIERADLDGSNREELVTGLSIPNRVALDLVRGKMYWTDDGTNRIERADLDGSNVEDLLIPGLNRPYGITVDPAGAKVYWADGRTRKLQRANLDGTGVEDLVSTTPDTPYDIDLDLDAGKMYWVVSGGISSTSKVLRADLDGSNVEELVSSGLRDPRGIALHAETDRMYLTDSSAREVDQAGQDGSKLKTLVTCDLSSPYGIAIAFPPALLGIVNGTDATDNTAELIWPKADDVGLEVFEILVDRPVTYVGSSVTSTGSDPTPAVVGLTHVGGGLHSVELEWPIEVGQWTVVTLDVASAAAGTPATFRLCLGHLPGDVNGDGEVNTNDATAFGQAFHGNGPQDRADLNNDGQANLNDATLFGQLWHGTSGHDAWQNRWLPPGSCGTGGGE